MTTDDGAEPEDYEIKRFIKHPQYRIIPNRNDIALIELRKNVKFTDFIRPACLIQDDNDREYSVIAVSANLSSHYSS